MYIVGTFDRIHSDHFSELDDNPMDETKVVEHVAKDHLIQAQRDESYQVINLDDLTFFNPKKNTWQPIQKAY